MSSTGQPESSGAASVVRFVSEAATRIGLQSRLLDPEHGYLFAIGEGSRWKPMIGGRSPLNDAVAARLAGDKFYTSRILADAGHRVPRTARCLAPGAFANQRYAESVGFEPGLALAAELGYPLIVKPNSKSHGRGVEAVASPPELEHSLAEIWKIDPVALVSELVPGTDLRLDFLDGKYLFGYERYPVVAVGDGSSSLRQLVEAIDSRRCGDAFWESVVRDRRWRRLVVEAGWDASTVLPRGKTLELGGAVLNLHQWAAATLVPEIPDRWLAWAAEIGRLLRLRHFGLDLRGVDLGQDPRRATILEANASPLLLGMYDAGHREAALDAQAQVLALAWQADQRFWPTETAAT